MNYEFVRSAAETVANILAFERDIANRGSLPPEEDRDLQVLTARTELWALYRDSQDRWHAGPCKYITLRNISPLVYTKIRHGVHSGNAANHLRLWLPKHPVSRSHPGWLEVEALAKAHTIGGHAKSEAVAFVLFDALASSTTAEAEDKVEAREHAALGFSEIEEREVNLMVALARAMRPEVRSIALRELAAI
jgi:hypothetical protein